MPGCMVRLSWRYKGEWMEANKRAAHKGSARLFCFDSYQMALLCSLRRLSWLDPLLFGRTVNPGNRETGLAHQMAIMPEL
jgi:hypothetical protein